MKRQALSYSLLFLFLFGALVPGQTQEELTKLPILLQHYQMHKAQSPETTLVQYLQLHYGDGFAQHSTAHDHSKLPMKSGDNHLHPPVPVDTPKGVEIVLQANIFFNQLIVSNDQASPQSCPIDIWQPPRRR